VSDTVTVIGQSVADPVPLLVNETTVPETVAVKKLLSAVLIAD